MKSLFMAFVFFLASLEAQNISWYGDFEQARQKAIEERKTLMVLLIKKECFACDEILSKTFRSDSVVERVNELFVSVLISEGQKGTYPIEMLYTMEYPAVFFLDNQELFVGKNIFGYLDSDEFVKRLNLYFSPQR